MFPTTQSSITDLSSALARSQVQPTAAGSGGKAFMKFDFKSGDFLFGRDAEDITGEEIVVNTASINHGWVVWANGTPRKVTASFVEPLPMAPEPIEGNQPTESRGFEARFEDDADTVLIFESNSFGGRKGVDSLLSEIQSRSAKGEVQYLYPVVKLTSESYKAKQGNTIHNPVFEVVGWMDQEGNRAGAATTAAIGNDEDDTEEDSAQPMRRRRRSV